MNQRGFTLLEFIIAFAIVTMVIITVYITQGNNLSSSLRTANLITARNLASNLLAESEAKLTGKPFGTLKEEETGTFPAPNENFSWKREIKEVDFSALTQLIALNSDKGISEQDKMMFGFVSDFLKKNIRKLVVTIQWPEGKEKSSLYFTMFLVDENAKM